MTLNLDRAIRGGDFDMDLPSVGRIYCSTMGVDALSAARATRVAGLPPPQVSRRILSEIAHHSLRPEGKAGWTWDDKVSAQEAEDVDDDEIEQFAEAVVARHKGYLETDGGDPIERHEGESGVEFLGRMVDHRAAEERKAREKIATEFDQAKFSDGTRAARAKQLDANRALNDQMARVMSDFPKFDPASIRNPLGDTNRSLVEVVRAMSDLHSLATAAVAVVQTMSETTTEIQRDAVTNAAGGERLAKAAIRISVVGILASTLFSVLTYIDSRSSGEQTEAQVKRVHSELAELASAQRDAAKLVADAVQRASVASREPEAFTASPLQAASGPVIPAKAR
ncbi:hypothetical protein [Aquabacterium sp.]|uniref:hypothetical protein n=1 Tax=Aquabacterium sp. TaxID=1872578 RepID=UPI0037831305